MVWIGFLGLFLGNGIKAIGGMDILGSFIYLFCFIVFIWGNLLVLKSKNRSWAWIFWILVPPILGAVFIFMLKDKSSMGATSTAVQPAPQRQ